MNLKKIGKVFTSKFVGTGPSSYKKRIYRAAVSQRLRNTAVGEKLLHAHGWTKRQTDMTKLRVTFAISRTHLVEGQKHRRKEGRITNRQRSEAKI